MNTLSVFELPSELLTVRDFFRYAISRFEAAGLVYGHGTASSVDEAAFLVLEALHLPIHDLNPYLDARLLASERAFLADLITKRVTDRKPLAYLLGKAYIQGIPFLCDERALVPRSYIGELLLSGALMGDEDNDVAGLIEDPGAIATVLDVCTGGGSLAIVAARVFENALVTAIDISADALALARENITLHNLEARIALYQGDMFDSLKAMKNRDNTQKFDLIIANPPYVSAQSMAALPAEFLHEPQLGLAGGDDGLALVRRIVQEAPDYLTPEGALMCEIGKGRAALEARYPHLPFLWLDTAASSGEVFWLNVADFG